MTDDDTPRSPSRHDIARLALALVQGTAYTMVDMPAEMARMVFLPLTLGALSHWSEEKLSQYTVFGVIGWTHHLEQSINGYPIFSEIKVWKLKYFNEALELATRLAQAEHDILKTFEAEQPEQDGSGGEEEPEHQD